MPRGKTNNPKGINQYSKLGVSKTGPEWKKPLPRAKILGIPNPGWRKEVERRQVLAELRSPRATVNRRKFVESWRDKRGRLPDELNQFNTNVEVKRVWALNSVRGTSPTWLADRAGKKYAQGLTKKELSYIKRRKR